MIMYIHPEHQGILLHTDFICLDMNIHPGNQEILLKIGRFSVTMYIYPENQDLSLKRGIIWHDYTFILETTIII